MSERIVETGQYSVSKVNCTKIVQQALSIIIELASGKIVIPGKYQPKCGLKPKSGYNYSQGQCPLNTAGLVDNGSIPGDMPLAGIQDTV